MKNIPLCGFVTCQLTHIWFTATWGILQLQWMFSSLCGDMVFNILEKTGFYTIAIVSFYHNIWIFVSIYIYQKLVLSIILFDDNPMHVLLWLSYFDLICIFLMMNAIGAFFCTH